MKLEIIDVLILFLAISTLMLLSLSLVKENKKLKEIIKPKQWDKEYIEILFSKSSKEEVIKAYTYKCEQLEKLHEVYNKQEIKYLKLKNDLEDVFDKMKEKQVQIDGRGYYYTDLLPIENILESMKGE